MSERCIIVMAKAPRPGRVKTRLCPPLGPAQAARIARAALEQTLSTVAATPADRRVLALDGPEGDWMVDGVEVIGQRGDGLGQRLANAVADVADRCLLIGMDTPQLAPDGLTAAFDRLDHPRVDAVLGRSTDGGWWALGLERPDPRVFAGVPMSHPFTGHRQWRRLERLGLRPAALPEMRDVDRIDDALEVAALVPGSRFAAAVAGVTTTAELVG